MLLALAFLSKPRSRIFLCHAISPFLLPTSFHTTSHMVTIQLNQVLFLLITTKVVSIDTSPPALPVVQPWTLPVFPAKKTVEKPLPHPHYFKSISNNESIDVATAANSGKLIPRYIWIAVKNASAELNYQIPELFKRNPLWRGFVCGNEEKVSST